VAPKWKRAKKSGFSFGKLAKGIVAWLAKTAWGAAAWAAGRVFFAAVWIVKAAWRHIAAAFSSAKSKYDERGKEIRQNKLAETAVRQAEYSPLRQIRAYEGNCGDFENWLHLSKSTVGIILGSRGSGKSALGMRLLENWAAAGKKVFAMGFGEGSVPPWIGMVDKIEEAQNGSVLLVDEGGIEFSSRESMSDANKLLSKLLFVCRHKDISLLFIAQNSANLEINSIRQADYLLMKKPSLLQKDFERGKIRDIYGGVEGDFRELGKEKGLVYVYSDRFRGFASNALPTFWSEKASKAYRGAKFESGGKNKG